MKAFILTEPDFEKLLTLIDRDPKHGQDGGSSQAQVRDPEQERIYSEAYRFYNYQVRRWIDEVKQ